MVDSADSQLGRKTVRRRDFLGISAALTATAAWPTWAKSELPLVIWVSYADRKTVSWYVKSVEKGLYDRGLINGKNIRFETYYADFSKDRLKQITADIVARNPAVCVVQGSAIKGLAAATRTIPLVVGSSGDLVASNMVDSMARPGGNITGVQFLAINLVSKRMELLKETLPRIRRVAVIADPGHAGETNERAKTISAAEQLGIRVDYRPVTTPIELQEALDATAFSKAQAIVTFPDAITFGPRKHIAEFAIRNQLPTVSGWDAYSEAGFLLVYGPKLTAAWKRMAYFVDRILKGAKPADLPAETPSVIELIVNLKTARALNIQVPETVLLRANRVIE